jgi:hypothetical protein
LSALNHALSQGSPSRCSPLDLAIHPGRSSFCCSSSRRWTLAATRWRFEVALSPHSSDDSFVAHLLPFVAIAFGHVVLGRSPNVLARVHAHEPAHVAQYERSGPVFLLAYPFGGFTQALCGRRPYLDNPFEVQARKEEHRAAQKNVAYCAECMREPPCISLPWSDIIMLPPNERRENHK